jgi:hypothetical protein
MATLIGLPVMLLVVLAQSSVVSRLSLGYGKADIVMLTIIAWTLQDRVTSHWQWAIMGGILVSLISAVPFYSFLISYLIIVLVCKLLKRNIWQMPIVVYLICVILGTFIEDGISWVGLTFSGINLPLTQSILTVVLPSLLFNTLLAIPIYFGLSDLARFAYPKRLEYE